VLEDQTETQQIVEYLQSDLYREATPTGTDDHAWVSPTGIRVQWSEGRGGGILRADGSIITVTSRMDVQTLEEYLP
jgi:hypothetical protein